MKYFFYTILLAASLGTVVAITNPPLVKQGAALLGLDVPQESAEPVDKAAAEDQLSKFLEQSYPSFNVQDNNVLPAKNLPMAVIPAPVPSPMPPPLTASSPTPSPSPPTPSPVIPEPVVESAVPPYARSWENPIHENSQQNISPWERDFSPWDGAAATPINASIYMPPATEPHPPLVSPPPDWSGPAQAVQDWTPAPQQSVYVVEPSPPQDVFPAMPNHVAQNSSVPPPHAVPDFAQTNLAVPPVQTPSFQHAPISHPPPPVSPSVPQTETVPVHGTEMVARVGTQVILMGDILPKLRRLAMRVVAENTKEMSAEDRARITPQEIEEITSMIIASNYPAMLEEQILFTLVHSDYVVSRSRDEIEFFEGKMTEEFNRVEIPEMMKEFNVENVHALRRFLENHLGSSLEKEQRLWIREQIARQWIAMSIPTATVNSTHEEMFEFYEKNQEMFTTPAQVRWQEMVVLFSRHDTEQQAWEKIVWMGNQVALQGASFEETARRNSEGLTSSEGGIWNWTQRGELTSAELEQAIFAQPVGQLSPNIIRSNRGLHIVRVMERQEAIVVPFVEAQVTIRDRIRRQREQQFQAEYIAELHRRIPMIIVKDRIDFNVNVPRTAMVGDL